MLTFKQFVTELAREEVTLSPFEVREMKARFGDKICQLGHAQEDGSMLIPVDCIMEAARSMGSRSLSEAAESIGNDQMVSWFHSGEVLVERVIEARKRKLTNLVGEFQNEPHAGKADQRWREIEKLVFGVEFND